MPKKDTRAPRMRGYNQRNLDGELRKIRGDTKIKTLEKRYHIKLAARSNMRWDTFKKKKGVGAVKKALAKFR